MRHQEIIENTINADKQRIDGQKKQADAQMPAQPKAKQKAKVAELQLKQQQNADVLKKLNARTF